MSDRNDVDLEFHYLQLREWARGLLPLMGATEVLIRTGFAQPGRPWVRVDSRAWIDFEGLPEAMGGMSGGQQRLLLAIASLAEAADVRLGDVVSGLDRSAVDLLLAGIAEAAGHPELHSWPES